MALEYENGTGLLTETRHNQRLESQHRPEVHSLPASRGLRRVTTQRFPPPSPRRLSSAPLPGPPSRTCPTLPHQRPPGCASATSPRSRLPAPRLRRRASDELPSASPATPRRTLQHRPGRPKPTGPGTPRSPPSLLRRRRRRSPEAGRLRRHAPHLRRPAIPRTGGWRRGLRPAGASRRAVGSHRAQRWAAEQAGRQGRATLRWRVWWRVRRRGYNLGGFETLYHELTALGSADH